MSIELLKSNNYITVNLSTIKVLGLAGAVYCSEIFNSMNKVAMLDTYQIKVDRNEIADKLGIPVNEQRAIEDRWRIMHLIEEVPNAPENVFKVNVDMFSTVVLGAINKSFNKEEVAKLKAKLSPKTSEKDKEAKRKGIANRIKEGLICPNVEVKEKMEEWIDIVTDSGKALSEKIVKGFLDTIKSYSSGDVSVMLKVIQEAINSSYTNVTYAISAYERSLKNKKVNPSAEFRRATDQGRYKF